MAWTNIEYSCSLQISYFRVDVYLSLSGQIQQIKKKKKKKNKKKKLEKNFIFFLRKKQVWHKETIHVNRVATDITKQGFP